MGRRPSNTTTDCRMQNRLVRMYGRRSRHGDALSLSRLQPSQPRLSGPEPMPEQL